MQDEYGTHEDYVLDLDGLSGNRCEGWGHKHGSCEELALTACTGLYCRDCDNARRAFNMNAFFRGTTPTEAPASPRPAAPQARKTAGNRPDEPLPSIPPAPKNNRNRNRRRGRKAVPAGQAA